MSRTLITTLFASLVLFAGDFVDAAAINVDFGESEFPSLDYVGTAAAPDAGTKWNGIYVPLVGGTSLSSGALVDSLNNASSVTFTVSATTSLQGLDNPSLLGRPADYSNTGAPLLTRDELDVTGSGTATVVISGLNNSLLYDLYIYSDRQFADGAPVPNTTTYTIGATSYTTIPNDASTTGFTLTEDYVHFTNVAPTLGDITFTFTAGPTFTYGSMNGFQLVPLAVPEPSGITLLLLGSAAMFRFKSRRNKQ